MSNPSPGRRRRERTAFHYKVDEDLKAADRDPYLALLRAPKTRIDDAHAWLLTRGYACSRSAVARHRRRLLAADAEQQAGLRHAELFARFAGSPGVPDFAAAAEVQLQHLVFRHLLALDAPLRDAGHDPDAADEAARRLDPAELLQLTKIIGQLVELARLRAEHDRAKPKKAKTPPDPPPARTEEELRREIEGIVFGKK